jgi:hypothetical protein
VPFETWTSSADDAESLARSLEAHLNEFAERVISVSYSVNAGHHVLAVYEPVGPIAEGAVEEEAIIVAEQIIDGAHSP